jgi:hypothetical protein
MNRTANAAATLNTIAKTTQPFIAEKAGRTNE